MSITSSVFSDRSFNHSESSASSYGLLEDYKFDEFLNYDDVETGPLISDNPYSDLIEYLSALLFKTPKGVSLQTIYKALQSWMKNHLPCISFVVQLVDLENVSFQSNFMNQPTCLALLIGKDDLPIGVSLMSQNCEDFAAGAVVSFYLAKNRTTQRENPVINVHHYGISFQETPQSTKLEYQAHDEQSFGMWLEANLAFFFQA
ncbi:protein of unknown function [Taphrina deformans PYCC 5710]|uniref:Uncharacterized protein n=1 Tax=Taphrina deformans (strain PYCC 5710 / ATCC 11124 / CBS 356.35 / IMI 108563 / JCM 9778 / NBRC 8474) TaxID=1097556 RepID=R4XEU1_TAPDE|nr:protein of unknown function [Taphrina deformans PYCC 5710]|eukprot:CCG84301.1 protein of unknown function [Taphrina deformans PYCC 5710]